MRCSEVAQPTEWPPARRAQGSSSGIVTQRGFVSALSSSIIKLSYTLFRQISVHATQIPAALSAKRPPPRSRRVSSGKFAMSPDVNASSGKP